ncbi:ATP-binding cassette domain-containing protein [Janibacter sp. CX7]|jgi:putative ABC transport system ATP-binding protein|uniref:ABC transporter ATP-binding protein n=1 Tax=Janibacter sp. CX7 TaxID=2963431 RepID=UPI0020CFDC7B|nr:ATP-binding cassette domain-containing protein [Janibacter sp. CX7]UTT65898.1 ATP-binding cassette domain-containing protein [Janibacter sp. CX7]
MSPGSPATTNAPDRTGGVLVLDDVSVRYGEVVAVDGASATARPGEVTAVTGHSGAGKTSLLWAVGGLLAPGQASGSITLGDTAIGEEATSRAAGAVLIPQGSALAEVLTARDNVAVPLVAAGVPGGDALAQADHALASVGLDEHGDHLAEELSGGQRQRVAVARGLALASLRLGAGAAVLLADEPTSELDHDTRERVVVLLEDLARRGATVLLATHDPEVAEIAPARWHLDDGRLTPTP